MIAASFRQISIAVQFLTRLPMPRLADVSNAEFADSMRWFPAAGLVVGAVVAGAVEAGAMVDPWLGALAGAIAWVAITGGLHLDGLADLSDALGAAHRDRQRFLEVLADPRIGSFGVLALILQIAAKLVLLKLVVEIEVVGVIIAIPVAARIGPLLWARWLPPLSQGLGALFANAGGVAALGIWVGMLAAAMFFWPALAAAPLLILGWWWFLHARVGGVSGDCHGAGIELVETGLLLSLVVAAHISPA